MANLQSFRDTSSPLLMTMWPAFRSLLETRQHCLVAIIERYSPPAGPELLCWILNVTPPLRSMHVLSDGVGFQEVARLQCVSWFHDMCLGVSNSGPSGSFRLSTVSRQLSRQLSAFYILFLAPTKLLPWSHLICLADLIATKHQKPLMKASADMSFNISMWITLQQRHVKSRL